ncbi:hypothetical protein RRG08_041947 [Elysia crispata]|uniref:Uncharacterized protein n=1 Tax=Elysia crispata TaxID=231223 RepID=A0AAE0XXF2_9GAST|nr:hypothetical protein RRG08_041947 [Elysia crispata]
MLPSFWGDNYAVMQLSRFIGEFPSLVLSLLSVLAQDPWVTRASFDHEYRAAISRPRDNDLALHSSDHMSGHLSSCIPAVIKSDKR